MKGRGSTAVRAGARGPSCPNRRDAEPQRAAAPTSDDQSQTACGPGLSEGGHGRTVSEPPGSLAPRVEGCHRAAGFERRSGSMA
jgi:hypothetical protein